MKRTLLTLLAVLALVLTACGSASTSAGAGSATSTVSLPAQTELLVGLFKLEGTAQALTKEQAAALLPIWQVMKELLSSDTAAQAEVSALAEQTRTQLTDAQWKAIQAMNLTPQDVMAVLQEKGTVGGTSNVSNGTASRGSSRSAGNGGGPGGPPPDGGGAIMGSAPAGTGSTTSAASSSTAATGLPSALIDAFLQLLETRASS